MSQSPGASLEGAPGDGVPSEERRRPRTKRVILAAMPLALLVVIAFVDFPVCPTRLALGVPCPGCGLTRATMAALSLDVMAILRFHPLAPILTPLVAWSFSKPILLELGWIRQEWVNRIPRPHNAVWWAVGVAMVVIWAARVAGYWGGHADPVDFSEGVIYRVVAGVWALVVG